MIVSFQKDATEKLREMPCPIARGLERVGEWWSILILRDAFGGLTRFDEFQKSLGIAPNMLTRRLAALVEAGMLERRRYNERPPRDEYVLTERGRDLRAGAGGDAGLGQPPFRAGGREHADRRRRDRRAGRSGAGRPPSGRPLAAPDFVLAAGPAATERARRRLASGSGMLPRRRGHGIRPHERRRPLAARPAPPFQATAADDEPAHPAAAARADPADAAASWPGRTSW